MTRFFRNIRQNLLSEGRTFKYIKYAFGEIIIVIIGILIAIQLNTWKSETNEKAQILKSMEGLQSDLNQDEKRFDYLYTFYKNITDTIQFLIKYSDQHKKLPNDKLGEMFNQILDYRKFQFKKSNYLSLINDGSLNKIRDEKLINEIIDYYESPYLIWSTEIYGNVIGSIDFNKSDIYDSRDGLILLNRNSSIPGWKLTNIQYHTDYEKLIRSKWAINIFSSCLQQANDIFSNIITYKKFNKQLRKSIENYKNKY